MKDVVSTSVKVSMRVFFAFPDGPGPARPGPVRPKGPPCRSAVVSRARAPVLTPDLAADCGIRPSALAANMAIGAGCVEILRVPEERGRVRGKVRGGGPAFPRPRNF